MYFQTFLALKISLFVCVHWLPGSECKKRHKGMVPQEPPEGDVITVNPEGHKMVDALDPYAMMADPTGIDALWTQAFELPENKPNQQIKKLIRKAVAREIRREMRLKLLGKSRHPNTENNWRTKRTEADFTSVETKADDAYIENKFTNLFIE